MMNESSIRVAIGQPVYTNDGDRLGSVKEVQGAFFKVDAPMAPDYWLPVSSVSTATGNQVTLSFDTGHLGDYRTNGPEAALPAGSAATGGVYPSSAEMSGRPSSIEGTTAAGADWATRAGATAGESLTRGTAPATQSMSSGSDDDRRLGSVIASGTGSAPLAGSGFDSPSLRGMRSGSVGAVGSEQTVISASGNEGRMSSGWQEIMPRFQRSYESRAGQSGGSWQDAEPGYRYGYEMANDERYRGRHWSDVETNIGSEYMGWRQRQGYSAPRGQTGGWDSVKEHAREAWDSVSGKPS